MDENERNPFGFLSGLGDAAQPMTPYQSPDLAARAPVFGGYGYQAPSMNMVMAPNQMPRMAMNPDAINDPSVAAALQILNQPMMIGQMPNMMGSGTNYQEQYALLPSIAAAPMQRQAMPQITPDAGLMQYMAGGGDSNQQFSYDAFPLGSDAPAGLSYAQQNQDMMDVGWSPMGYDDSAQDMSGFGDYTYGSDGSVGGFV